jgi:hypothetical protein
VGGLQLELSQAMAALRQKDSCFQNTIMAISPEFSGE